VLKSGATPSGRKRGEMLAQWPFVRALAGRLRAEGVPVIPGVQDEDEFERIASFCSVLENDPPVRLIPYHRLGDSKYAALGWPVPEFRGSDEEQMALARTAFHKQGICILEQG
jgi:pyruvate-formate lyase-activating enzyme